MRIGILTWLYNGNYGTVLQAYALQKFLMKNTKYYIENIDYNPDVKAKIINLIKSRNSLSLIFEKLDYYIANKIARNNYEIENRKRRFSDFLLNEMNLSEKYKNPKEIEIIKDKYDIYICGSDQIWSPVLLNPVYYFSFLDSNKKLISYAPSFGVSCIKNSKKEEISGYLKKFNHISVREENGAKIIYELIGRKVEYVVDPTLLISKEEWDKIASIRLIQENYIICYFLSYKKEYSELIDKLSLKTGYKVAIICTTEETYKTNYKKIIDCGPKEWVSLIKNAKLVLTDSFHGCVFSTIYKKDFYLFKRFNDNNNKSQNSRIYNFINMLDLSERLIDDINSHDYSNINIENYDEVYAKLEQEKNKSIKWLLNAIEY